MATQSLTSERLASEWKQLQSSLAPHSFQFCGLGTDSPYVLMKAKTESGRTYNLRVELKEFPAKAPEVFVQKLISYEERGNPIPSMRTNRHGDKGGDGSTPSSIPAKNEVMESLQIELYPQGTWSSDITLLDVYRKSLDWLQRYEEFYDRSFEDE